MRPDSADRATPAAVAGALALAMVASLVLRTGALDAGYWIDEAIAVGIASHDFADIPAVLRLDGSPPLYYLLLHVWMELVGSGEAATRTLSLLFAVIAVPVAWWAGRAAFDRRVAALATAGAAGSPFLTYYAQETRMYALVVLLSMVAAAAFVLAFLHGRRGHLVTLGISVTLLLYSHAWAAFLAAGMAVAWLRLWRAKQVAGRDGVWLGAAVALAYAPWVPSMLFQAAHTAAPWMARPAAYYVLGVPATLFGYVATPLLAVAAVRVLRAGRPGDEATRSLVLIVVVATLLAWSWSQVQPSWAPRYAAVLFGPLLLALAATLARGTRWTAAALAAVAATWLLSGPPPEKSNVRAVAGTVAPAVRPGDVVVSTQPEQVPVLHRYLPPGLVYLTPLGIVPDPRMTDWRDGAARLRRGQAERTLLPVVDRLAPGDRVLLVTPVVGRRRPQGPWSRTVRVRTREWRAALRGDPRLRSLGRAPRSTFPRRRSTVRTELLEVRAAR